MRFIAEFELLTPFEIKNYKSLREKGTAEWLGLDIAKALFGLAALCFRPNFLHQ